VGEAAALTCPESTLKERLDAADGAFAGRIVSDRPGPGNTRVYRFIVDQRAKGPIGREIEVRSEPLVDAADEPVPPDVALGVFTDREGAVWTTASCSLTDPGALLSISDEPRGNWIKVLIGIAILGVVLLFSVRRLRHRRLQQAAQRTSSNGGPPDGDRD
jgi:hypothetical protein